MNKATNSPTIWHTLAAWSVHLLTASTAVCGVYTLTAIYHQQYTLAFWLMGVAVFIDAIDGTLARALDVKRVAARVDGALLDNIVDYLNYVITPSFLLMVHPHLLSLPGKDIVISIMVLASAYQFTQADAKTDDHFFKGFPCYWNFAVFYLFLFKLTAPVNAAIILLLAVLIFVPIKYVYPSRMDHLTHHPQLKRFMLIASVGYGAACAGLLLTYPAMPASLLIYSIAYTVVYFAFSLYRTLVPLNQ